MMRIAHVLLSPRQGGMETLVNALAAEMTDNGHDIEIFFVDDAVMSRSRMQRLWRLRSLLRQSRPDVVFAHSTIPIFYSRLAAIGLCPVVAVMHSAGNEWSHGSSRLFERLMWRLSVATAAVSGAKLAEYNKYFPSAAARLILLPNAVPVPAAQHCFAATSSVSRKANFLMAGRVVEQKQVVEAVRALQLLESLHPEAEYTLLMAGEWPDQQYADAVRSEIEKLKDPARVKVLGKRTDVTDLMASADILLHPSSAEASSLTLMEAAMVGLPAIVSGAVRMTVPPEQVALVFPTSDVAALCNMISLGISERDQLIRQAIAIAPQFRREYSIEAAQRRYIEVAKRAVNS